MFFHLTAKNDILCEKFNESILNMLLSVVGGLSILVFLYEMIELLPKDAQNSVAYIFMPLLTFFCMLVCKVIVIFILLPCKQIDEGVFFKIFNFLNKILLAIYFCGFTIIFVTTVKY
jgi:hypothetical protein